MKTPIKDIDFAYPLLLLIAASLPFFTVLNSVFIILLTLWSIVLLIRKKPLHQLRNYVFPVVVFSTLFIVYLLADIRDGIFPHSFILEKKMSLLIVPLAIGVCSINLNHSKSINILISFCLSTFLACLLSFVGHWDLISLTPNVATAAVLLIHRPYFGLYAFFCVLCLVYLIPYLTAKWKKALALAAVVFFLYFSFIIYAKMAILAFVGTVVLSTLVWAILRRKYVVLGSVLLLLMLSLTIVYHPLQQIAEKITRAEPFQIDENWIYFLSMNLRFAIWDCSWSVLTEGSNWLWGAGLGHQELLDSCYKTRSIWTTYNVDPIYLEGYTYNAHNELLHTWLDLGIIGPLALIFVGGYSIGKAIQYQNMFYFSFLVLFGLCCMTESMLSTQKGVVFYAFFNSLIFHLTTQPKAIKKQVYHN